MGRREAVLTPVFLEDLTYWIRTDRKLALRLLALIDAVLRDPFTGVGKPEPLKHLDPDTWSRRLPEEHRLIYRVRADRVDFLGARYHYG